MPSLYLMTEMYPGLKQFFHCCYHILPPVSSPSVCSEDRHNGAQRQNDVFLKDKFIFQKQKITTKTAFFARGYGGKIINASADMKM
jgi:hypothetical protein